MKKTNLMEPATAPAVSARANDKLSATAQKIFRADLNHKLRTPLNAIIGFAELMALQPTHQRGNGDVQQILRSARELLRILERELGEGKDRLPEQAGAITPVAPGCDILYVEDDIVNFTLVERILELRPHLSVMHAVRGELGIEFAEAYQPKLILLDLNLPDMHGAEVLRTLTATPGDGLYSRGGAERGRHAEPDRASAHRRRPQLPDQTLRPRSLPRDGG